MFDGAYPPGVTGDMIDEYFRETDPAEPPEVCQYCTFYEERTCGCICSVLEADYSETALGDMSDDEYMQKFGKKPDDTCDDFERWEE